MCRQAKSEHQLAAEKAWLDAEQVWLVHKDGFSAARLLRVPAGSGSGSVSGAETEPGRVRIRLQDTGETIEVDEDDIEKVGGDESAGHVLQLPSIFMTATCQSCGSFLLPFRRRF